ncbi:hypothetical protein Tco_0048946 [Tanacetum coccineum]
MNDFKRSKHFPEKIASNLKFLNNLQPEWKRHITIVCQTKDLHELDYTQLYDFLKMNQEEVNELRAERLTKTHDPLALMAYSQNPYNYQILTRREMSDMQDELLALQGQQRRARQPGSDARSPDHQDASGDADSHI